MFFARKTLLLIVSALGLTVLLGLVVFQDLLHSHSDADHVRRHSLTFRKGYTFTEHEDLLVPLPTGMSASLNLPGVQVSMDNTHASDGRNDLNAEKLVGVSKTGALTEASAKPVTPLALPSSTGYVFSVVYWEQMASGACNIMSLQCWAGKLNPPMFVLQPFYWDGWPRSLPIFMRNVITFSDIFDINRWNNVSSSAHYAPLVNSKEYKLNAPRNLIIVKIIYWWLNTSNSTGLDRKTRLGLGCDEDIFRLEDSLFTRFLIIRKVCINLSYGDILTLEEFNEHIFGGHSPGSVSVVFKDWRGISARNKFRVIINDSNCEWHYVPIRQAWSPSARVKEAADRYIAQFLGNSDYVALMMRMEWALRGRNTSYLDDILTRVLRRAKEVQQRVGTNVTFLAADVGRFGSATLHVPASLWESFTDLFKKLYNGSMTVSEWENSFEEISGTRDQDFVAMVQAMIVTRAKCVIFVGHGNFQKHTKYLYEDAHSREPTPCIEHIH